MFESRMEVIQPLPAMETYYSVPPPQSGDVPHYRHSNSNQSNRFSSDSTSDLSDHATTISWPAVSEHRFSEALSRTNSQVSLVTNAGSDCNNGPKLHARVLSCQPQVKKRRHGTGPVWKRAIYQAEALTEAGTKHKKLQPPIVCNGSSVVEETGVQESRRPCPTENNHVGSSSPPIAFVSHNHSNCTSPTGTSLTTEQQLASLHSASSSFQTFSGTNDQNSSILRPSSSFKSITSELQQLAAPPSDQLLCNDGSASSGIFATSNEVCDLNELMKFMLEDNHNQKSTEHEPKEVLKEKLLAFMAMDTDGEFGTESSLIEPTMPCSDIIINMQQSRSASSLPMEAQICKDVANTVSWPINGFDETMGAQAAGHLMELKEPSAQRYFEELYGISYQTISGSEEGTWLCATHHELPTQGLDIHSLEGHCQSQKVLHQVEQGRIDDALLHQVDEVGLDNAVLHYGHDLDHLIVVDPHDNPFGDSHGMGQASDQVTKMEFWESTENIVEETSLYTGAQMFADPIKYNTKKPFENDSGLLQNPSLQRQKASKGAHSDSEVLAAVATMATASSVLLPESQKLKGDDDRDHQQQPNLPMIAPGLAHHYDIFQQWPVGPAGSGDHHHIGTDYNGIRLIHLLIAGAEAVGTRDMDLAAVILVRLKELVSISGSTMQRVAACFSEGLQHRIEGGRSLQQFNAHHHHHQGTASAAVTATMATSHSSSSSSNINGSGDAGRNAQASDCGGGPSRPDLLAAFQILHEIFPYIKFGHFTANQAILEAIKDEKRIHIVDYEIMEGIQWPSLMQALVSRKEGPPLHLRITALSRPHAAAKRMLATVQETGKRLSDFAASLNLPFTFNQLRVDSDEEFRASALKLVKGEALVANCMLHLPHMPYRTATSVSSFLKAMRKLYPVVLTLVEEELGCNTPSISSYFFEALHHYSAIFDSLEACLPSEAVGRMLVERVFLAPRIANAVTFCGSGTSTSGSTSTATTSTSANPTMANAGSSASSSSSSTSSPSSSSNSSTSMLAPCADGILKHHDTQAAAGRCNWCSLVSGAGFKAVPLSFHNLSQARLLLGLFKDGFKLQESGHRLLLGWRSQALIAASAWH